MDFKELIEMINKNTAAQEEQTKKMERHRQELGVAPLLIQEREPTELELMLQKWELSSREAKGVELPSREPEGVELPSREPEGVELPLPEPRGEEPSLPEPPTVQCCIPPEIPEVAAQVHRRTPLPVSPGSRSPVCTVVALDKPAGSSLASPGSLPGNAGGTNPPSSPPVEEGEN
ncbi:UNVERIFIED_CONTAM: hypothetical protein FKN15_052142 [Acipenser sinensis]